MDGPSGGFASFREGLSPGREALDTRKRSDQRLRVLVETSRGPNAHQFAQATRYLELDEGETGQVHSELSRLRTSTASPTTA